LWGLDIAKMTLKPLLGQIVGSLGERFPFDVGYRAVTNKAVWERLTNSGSSPAEIDSYVASTTLPSQDAWFGRLLLQFARARNYLVHKSVLLESHFDKDVASMFVAIVQIVVLFAHLWDRFLRTPTTDKEGV